MSLNTHPGGSRTLLDSLLTSVAENGRLYVYLISSAQDILAARQRLNALSFDGLTGQWYSMFLISVPPIPLSQTSSDELGTLTLAHGRPARRWDLSDLLSVVQEPSTIQMLPMRLDLWDSLVRSGL